VRGAAGADDDARAADAVDGGGAPADVGARVVGVGIRVVVDWRALDWKAVEGKGGMGGTFDETHGGGVYE
jgi:hypothetical protein